MDRAIVESVPLFEDVPQREWGSVASWADEVDAPAGATLIHQGGYAREFFVILEGTADVVRDGEHLATLGPGEFFGEVGMLDRRFRTASVTARTDMRLLVVAPREFATMMHSAPSVAERIAAAAAKRAPKGDG